jgi:hypothetical protein
MTAFYHAGNDRIANFSSVNLKCAGLVDHTEHYLQVFDGRCYRASLYLPEHPIATQLAELLGSWNLPGHISFGVTNSLFVLSHIPAHALTDLVRSFPLKAQDVFHKRFNALVHRFSPSLAACTRREPGDGPMIARFAELVRLLQTSIADEMREEYRRRVLGE